MRVLALATAMIGLAAVGSSAAGSSPGISLRITYWEDSAITASVTWTLRCDPPRGSLPRPTPACNKLALGGTKLFAPTSPKSVCTEIYGGPQKTRVVGTVAGRRVWARFSRTNGCEIARWQRISPWLVPPGGVS